MNTRWILLTITALSLSNCVMQEGSGEAMGERTGRIARKGARETKNFFKGIASGWKSEDKAPPLSPPPPSPAGVYAYPQATQPSAGVSDRGY